MNGVDFGFGPIEGELWRLVFAMTRIGAALLAAPFFGAVAVPVQLRVAMAGGIAVLVVGWVPLAAPPALFSLEGMTAVLGEVSVGLALGFVLQIAFAAPIIAAEQIGGAMGMAIATAADPVSGGHSPALGQYFNVLLSVTFLALGCHLEWLALVVKSYSVFAPGHAWLGAERFHLVAGFGGEMLVTAVGIALPVTLVLLLTQMLTAVLSRSAPSLNLFSLGLPVGVLAGLAALIAAAPLAADRLAELCDTMIGQAGALLAQ